MLRKILIVLMSLSLCWTTFIGGNSAIAMEAQPTFVSTIAAAPTSLNDGKYPVQQATYDDASGEYSLMLLNTPPGVPPVLQTTDVQMARLSDEAIANGEKTYLQRENKQSILYLTEDFKIEYVHNVTETETNPRTGETQTVVVRRESNFWTPFAGAIAGQAIGNMLFSPRYYVPPMYSGGALTGYGGYGRTYSTAVNRYQKKHKTSPPAVKNRQKLRTSGNIRNSRNTKGSKFGRSPFGRSRSTGSGFGSSTLRTSGKAKSNTFKRPSGFGSSSRSFSRPRSSFGGSRGGFGGSRRSFGGRRR